MYKEVDFLMVVCVYICIIVFFRSFSRVWSPI